MQGAIPAAPAATAGPPLAADAERAPAAPAPSPQRTRLVREFVVGAMTPADAAAAAAPAPDDGRWEAALAAVTAAAAGPPPTARLPVEVVAAVSARLDKNDPGVRGRAGAAALHAAFGGALPWTEGELYE
jgi:hypothetical protein